MTTTRTTLRIVVLATLVGCIEAEPKLSTEEYSAAQAGTTAGDTGDDGLPDVFDPDASDLGGDILEDGVSPDRHSARRLHVLLSSGAR
jgi:hypothetical protein